MSENCYNDLYRDKILTQLMDDKITFSEACDKLDVSRSDLDEMLNNFDHQISLERLKELRQVEKETISAIKQMVKMNI